MVQARRRSALPKIATSSPTRPSSSRSWGRRRRCARSPELAAEMVAAIGRITPQPVREVVVTHYHPTTSTGCRCSRRSARRSPPTATAGPICTATPPGCACSSRSDLAPWIDADTQLVPADRWIAANHAVHAGRVDFVLLPAGRRTREDRVVVLPQRRCLIAGDIVFRGRIPFVGEADSGRWIEALDRLLSADVDVIVPGHGRRRPTLAPTCNSPGLPRPPAPDDAGRARNLEPFDEAYAKADWSAYAHLPLFKAANRINAYNTYLLMEQTANEHPPQRRRNGGPGVCDRLAGRAVDRGVDGHGLGAGGAGAARRGRRLCRRCRCSTVAASAPSRRRAARWSSSSGRRRARFAGATTSTSRSCVAPAPAAARRWWCWAWRATATPQRCAATRRARLRVPITLAAAPLAAALATRKVVPLTVTVDRAGRLRQTIAGEMSEDDVLELAALATRRGR